MNCTLQGWYPLVICYIAIEHVPVEIVSFHIENGDFPQQTVSLPGGHVSGVCDLGLSQLARRKLRSLLSWPGKSIIKMDEFPQLYTSIETWGFPSGPPCLMTPKGFNVSNAARELFVGQCSYIWAPQGEFETPC